VGSLQKRQWPGLFPLRGETGKRELPSSLLEGGVKRDLASCLLRGRGERELSSSLLERRGYRELSKTPLEGRGNIPLTSWWEEGSAPALLGRRGKRVLPSTL